MCCIFDENVTISADPGFLWRGGGEAPTLKVLTQTFSLDIFCTAWKWKKLDRGCHAFLTAPADPPMSTVLSSKQILFSTVMEILILSELRIYFYLFDGSIGW